MDLVISFSVTEVYSLRSRMDGLAVLLMSSSSRSSQNFLLVVMFNFFFSSRELIAEGQTGGLVIFQDRPNYWDAWGMYTGHTISVIESTTDLWI